jgi:hypothetical protein
VPIDIKFAYVFPAPLFDPDPNTQQIVAYGVGSNVLYQADLDATTWGVALKGQTVSPKAFGSALYIKLGTGYRRIDTDLSINGGRASGGAGIPIPLKTPVAATTKEASAKPVDCKKFFPSVGLTLSVPCE